MDLTTDEDNYEENKLLLWLNITSSLSTENTTNNPAMANSTFQHVAEGLNNSFISGDVSVSALNSSVIMSYSTFSAINATFKSSFSTITSHLPPTGTTATTLAQLTTETSLAAPRGPEPLGLLALLIVNFLGNLLVCLAVKLDKRLHTMTYYFFMSLAAAHLLMLTIVMPPALLVLLTGSFQYSEDLCKLWVTLDLFFCNNTCLHLAFTNMDTFLRLKDPLRHGRITTTCSVVLWIGAPWMISFVQAIAQFMLSQGDHGIIHDGICFIADKNFVILGTLFSFIIPTVISVLFYIMCILEIQALKGGRFLDEGEGSMYNIYRYASKESMGEEEGSDTASCVSEIDVLPSDKVQLATVTKMKDFQGKDGVKLSPTNSFEETTDFCNDSTNTEAPTSFADHLLSTDQNASCTLLLRDAPQDDGNCLIRPNAEDDHDSPDEHLRHEQSLSRLMFFHLLLTISLWVPLSVSSVTYGICSSCRTNMTFHQSMTFKWLAYSSSVLGPFLYGKFSETMRDVYFKIILCHYSCKYKHWRPA